LLSSLSWLTAIGLVIGAVTVQGGQCNIIFSSDVSAYAFYLGLYLGLYKAVIIQIKNLIKAEQSYGF
jgi:hypothetical protein